MKSNNMCSQRDESLCPCAASKNEVDAPKACFIWMSQIAKSPLVSLETARSGCPLKPTESPQEPTEELASRLCVPTSAEKTRR